MDTLYELSAAYADLLNAIEAGDIPEEAIDDTLEGLKGALEDKADNVACFIKQLSAEANDIREEELALAERRKAKEAKAARLRDYLSRELTCAGLAKVETARNRISFRKSAAVDIFDQAAFEGYPHLENYLIYAEPKPDKKAISEAIKNGTEIPGCKIVEHANIQIK